MKRRATVVAAALAVVLLSGALSKPASADVSFSFFYSNLSPYGSWAVSADYGQVWRPYDYAPGWNPYYDGHWVYTDYGWAWVSDYAWGSIPYHYGTWALDPALGWIWVPGYVWAPAWVAFTSGPDYIGWAPVPPRYVVGASVSFRDFGPDRCVIVPARSFLAPRIRGYAVPRANVNVAISRTHIVNNITLQDHVVVNHGPDPRGIERATGRALRPEPIARVKHVAPGGRFDAQDVRADRYVGGGAPRVTAPERTRSSEPARRPEPPRTTQASRPQSQASRPQSQATRPQSQATRPQQGHHPAPAHQPAPAYQPAPASRSGAVASRPDVASQRQPSHENRPPQSQPPQSHAQQGRGPQPQTAHPGNASQKPQKPPHEGHGAGNHEGHGGGNHEGHGGGNKSRG